MHTGAEALTPVAHDPHARVAAAPTADPNRDPDDVVAGRRRRGPRGWRSDATVFAVTLLGTLAVLHQVWAAPLSRSVGAGFGDGGDAVQSMWFLAWTPHALAAGHNPWFTDAVYHPLSTSLAWNTSIVPLGILAAPVTLTAGPVLAYNLLLTLSAPLTAVTTRRLLTRVTPHRTAASVGAVAFALGPWFAGHLQGHLNLCTLVLLPLMTAWVLDLLRGRARHPWRRAVALGAVTAVQLGISEEMILIVAGGVLVALLTWALLDRTACLAAVRRAAGPVGLAAVVAAALASPLLITQLVLSSGFLLDSAVWYGTVGDVVVPTDRFPNPFGLPDIVPAARNSFETTAYLGYPLVLVLGAVAVRRAADPRVRTAVVVGLAGLVLSLGRGGGADQPGFLPWALLARLPVFENVLAVRLSIWLQAAAVVLVVVAVERIAAVTRPQGRVVGAVALVAALAFAAPLAIPAPTILQPAAFRDGALDRLPAGSPVLVLPMARPQSDQAMLWQAQAGFRFRMHGGYLLHATPTGSASQGPFTDELSRLVFTATDHGTVDAADLAATRRRLAADGTRAVVVVTAVPEVDRLRTLAVALTGRSQPTWTAGGVEVWTLRG